MAGTSKGDEGTGSGCGCGSENTSECDDQVLPMTPAASSSTAAARRSAQLTWQMSTPVSQARAEMVPEIAAMYKSILDSLGENSSREGLMDTPFRAAKAMLFFTKVNQKYSLYHRVVLYPNMCCQALTHNLYYLILFSHIFINLS